MQDLDRLIQNFYASAFEEEWQVFREHALRDLCGWLGARSAAWLTFSSPELPGEFTQHPDTAGIRREHLLQPLPDGVRDMPYRQVPGGKAPPSIQDGQDEGHLYHYAHRGGGLSSLILLTYPRKQKPGDVQQVRRGIGHMVEAGSLALRHFIQRDEWLYSLGRPSRGTAALVDSRGTLYAASPRFREMLEPETGTRDFFHLPRSIPDHAMDSDNSSFLVGQLHVRSSRHGNLYLLHARRPQPLDELSPREQEIARALGTGKTFKSVARQYDIAVSTVANHASRIYKKLGIFRREELVEMVRAPSSTTNTLN